MYGDEQRGQLQLPVLHHQVQQIVGLGVVADADVLREEENKRVSKPHSLTAGEPLCSELCTKTGLTMALLTNPPPWNSITPKASVG